MAFLYALDRVELSNPARQTGAVLVRFLTGGSSWVGQRRLKAEWGIRPERLNRDVAELVSAGLLDVSHRRGERGLTIYRSRARYVDESNLIVLDDGRQLPARPTVGTLGDTPSEASAPTVGRAAKKASVPNSRVQRSQFEGPARPTVGTNHHTTRTISEGGGGGGADAPCAPPDGGCSGAAPSDVVRKLLLETFDFLDEKLAKSKRPAPSRFDVKLKEAIAARLRGGWPPVALVDAMLHIALPEKVTILERILEKKVNDLPLSPEGQWLDLVTPILDAQQEWWDTYRWATSRRWVEHPQRFGMPFYERMMRDLNDGGVYYRPGTEECQLSDTVDTLLFEMFDPEDEELPAPELAPSTVEQCKHDVVAIRAVAAACLSEFGVPPHWQRPAKRIGRGANLAELQRAVAKLDAMPPEPAVVTELATSERSDVPAARLWQAGDKLRHKKFGAGVVTSVERSVQGDTLHVQFEPPAGERTLLATWAQVELVEAAS